MSNKDSFSTIVCEKVGVGTDRPSALLDIRSDNENYNAQTRDWPAESQIHISPHSSDEAGAFIGAKTENHIYMAAGIKRHAKGDWEVMTNMGATIISGLDGYHSFFTVPAGMKGQRLNPSDGIRMRISQNGDVGIGTIKPKHKLDVRGVVHSEDVMVTSAQSGLTEMVRELIPEAIFPDSDGEKSLSYNTILSYLLATVQQQQQEIQALRDELSGKSE